MREARCECVEEHCDDLCVLMSSRMSLVSEVVIGNEKHCVHWLSHNPAFSARVSSQ